MRIVISYAREDRIIVQELAETLRRWGHDTWTDAGAHSGARWWDEIMARIRDCDVLLAVVSPAFLTSKACALERQYAMAMRKVLLPVSVAPVNMQSLPPDLATIHFFDFTVRDLPAAGRLFEAIGQLPRPGQPPLPLPPPPPPPLSYLNDVASQLAALAPDLDRQHQLVTALTTGLRSSDAEERDTSADLIRRYLEHPQRLHDPAQRAHDALMRAPGPQPSRQPTWAPGPVQRSRFVTVLAWIGAATVLLVGLVIWGASQGSDAPVQSSTAVSQMVFDDLIARGLQPSYVDCGSLAIEVGASTTCEAPGVWDQGATVTVTNVQNGAITEVKYESA